MSRINLDNNPLFQEINSDVVVAVINFIYTGRKKKIIWTSSDVWVSGFMSSNASDENNLSDIFCLAHQWLLEDLVSICTKLMSQRVSSTNVFQLLEFAKQYDNTNLSNCAKRFIATNLPNVYEKEEFRRVEEQVMTEVFSDPIIFCHDDHAWLEAVRSWAGDSGDKMNILFGAIPLHLLAAEEKERIFIDNNFSSVIKGFIEKVAEDTNVTRSVVQYIPVDMFSLNEEPGWLMHTMKDKIVIERMEQFSKTDEHSHLSRGGVERAMQAFYGSNCYMFFESECPASNNRYIGDDHQHDQCSKEVKHIWCYNVVKKVWTKKNIVLKEAEGNPAPWDIDCLVCDFQVSLHIQASTLFCFLVGKEREILLRTELEGDDSSWQLLTSSAMVAREDYDIHPRLYTSTIIKVADDCIWFHGKADWDDEAKNGIFTMTFNHHVTFKIIVRPSLEIVIANFYKEDCNKMVILTHEKRPKPRLFEVTKHTYELTMHDLNTEYHEENSLSIDLLGVKGVFLHHEELHFICVKDAKPVQLRHEQETISKTYNIDSKVWQDRTITSLTSDSILYFKDSELGSTAFSVPYNLMYRKQYLTDWEGDDGSDVNDSASSSDAGSVVLQDNLVPDDMDLVNSSSDSDDD